MKVRLVSKMSNTAIQLIFSEMLDFYFEIWDLRKRNAQELISLRKYQASLRD